MPRNLVYKCSSGGAFRTFDDGATYDVSTDLACAIGHGEKAGHLSVGLWVWLSPAGGVASTGHLIPIIFVKTYQGEINAAAFIAEQQN